MSWQDVRYVPRVLAAINFVERPSHFSLECEVPYNVVCIIIQGGNNAGHTVKVGSQAYAFHLLPRYVAYNVSFKQSRISANFLWSTSMLRKAGSGLLSYTL